MENMLKMSLQINTSSDINEEELDLLTRQLLDEIQELEVESVEMVRDNKAPKDAKGDPITLGALALAVLPGLLPKLIDFLQNWLTRRKDQKVRVKIGVGDRSVELEYFPEAISIYEVNKIAEKLSGVITGRKKA
jgi:hypothetical protein